MTAGRTLLFLVLSAVLVTATGCRSTGSGAGDGRMAVVASFYPLAEAARQVGGAHARVEDLTPAGAEPHDLELTPRQLGHVHGADIVLVLGRGFQPAVEKAASGRRGTVVVIDDIPGSRARAKDPHVWLDPVLMGEIVDAVRASLTEADPGHAADYRAAASRYRATLTALDGRYRQGLADCDRSEIVTSHDAFGWLAARYSLEQESIAGLSPDAEPDPRRLARLAALVRAKGVTTIFTEELLSPRVAAALARETGAATAVLDPLESLTAANRRAGAGYVAVMDENLARLRAALGCH